MTTVTVATVVTVVTVVTAVATIAQSFSPFPTPQYAQVRSVQASSHQIHFRAG